MLRSPILSLPGFRLQWGAQLDSASFASGPDAGGEGWLQRQCHAPRDPAPAHPDHTGTANGAKNIFSKVTHLCFVAVGLFAPGSSGRGFQASACCGFPDWTQPLSPPGRERRARGGSKDSVMSRETRHPLTPTTQGRLTVQKIFFSKVTRLCFVAGGLLAPGSSGHGFHVAVYTSGRAAR